MESSETWRTKAFKSFAISKFGYLISEILSGMQGVWDPSVFPAEDVQTGRLDTPSKGGGTWAVAGCRNDVARLDHYSQWSGQHIRIRYAIVRVWCSRVSGASPWGSPDRRALSYVLLRNLDGVDPDSNARSVSSGGGVSTPCTRRQSPLRRLTFSGYLPSGILSGKHFHLLRIFHIRHLTSDGRNGGVSTSPDKHVRIPWQRVPGSLQAEGRILHSVSVFSCNIPIFAIDILRYFDLHFEIFCFRYLMSKSPNSPCNPPIIGFLSL